jgi:hypothetical protein
MDMHRMTWPEVICVAIAVLGIAQSLPLYLAGEPTLAFVSVIAGAGAWAVYNALADARESTHVRPRNVVDFRRTPDLHIPDYEAHTRIDGRVLCGQCGELGPLWTMAPHPVYGHRCHAHGRADSPEVA